MHEEKNTHCLKCGDVAKLLQVCNCDKHQPRMYQLMPYRIIYSCHLCGHNICDGCFGQEEYNEYLQEQEKEKVVKKEPKEKVVKEPKEKAIKKEPKKKVV